MAKNYANQTKISILWLFKMMVNQIECIRFQQRSVIKVLVTEKCKPCEIYRRICYVYGKVCFCKKKLVYKWAKLFKDLNRIQDKDE